jgi:hypothetical protein
MRLLRIANMLALGSGLLAIAACDGSVETTPGSGGSGGQSTGNAGSGNETVSSGGNSSVDSASVGSSVSSGTGGAPGSLCDEVCEQLQSLGCPNGGPDCVDECQEAAGQAPRCTAEFDAVLQCALTQQNCDIEDSCEPQLQAWAACAAATGCGPQECRGGGSGGGEETCSCNAVCEGTPVTADCTIDAAGGATCQCLANGMPVGECTEPQSSFCDVSEGCCAQFF